jgi:threonine dehydratase
LITLGEIRAARERIREQIEVTACDHSTALTRVTGRDTWLKLENLQATGSFKDRGALNKILSLSPEEKARGVTCGSAGNHAQAVSYFATRNGIRAKIVMPERAPLVKVTNTRAYGAEVILHGASFDDAQAEAMRLSRAEGLTYVHAFDDDAIIAGQGTIGLEIMEQCPELEAVVVPVGGGGLIGGIGCAVKETRPGVKVVGVEAARVPSMKQALAGGSPVTVPAATTIADGIAVRRAGERTLPLVEKYVDEVVTVDEEEIASAILYLLEREKSVAEGAGAAGVAALLEGRADLGGRKTVAVVCGGNIDPIFLARIIERGLVKDGRLVRLRVHASDTPGSLHEITGVLARLRANVMDVAHDRAYYGVNLGFTAIEVTFEARGSEHAAEVFAGISAAGYRFDRIM